MQEVKKERYKKVEDYLYYLAKQDLRIKDLRKYGIQVVLLDVYNEITGILKQIESAHLLKNIFISEC